MAGTLNKTESTTQSAGYTIENLLGIKSANVLKLTEKIEAG
jgi:hypothetical protein